jgi:hypothetical protein
MMPYNSPTFLTLANKLNQMVRDSYDFMTKPAMTKMLPDRLDLPNIHYPKVLVLNLKGTLVH